MPLVYNHDSVHFLIICFTVICQQVHDFWCVYELVDLTVIVRCVGQWDGMDTWWEQSKMTGHV